MIAPTLRIIQNSLNDERRWNYLRSPAAPTEAPMIWLKDPPPGFITPLADRVEMAIVRILTQRTSLRRPDLSVRLAQEFPGLETPTDELVEAVLDSYALIDPVDPDVLRLQPADDPRRRRADLDETHSILNQLGRQLGFEVQPGSFPTQPMLWTTPGNGQPSYVFYGLASAVIGRPVLTAPYPPEACVILHPGGRSGLIAAKIQHDFRYSEAIGKGWRFVKYRHIRRLSADSDLTAQTFAVRLNLDPLERTDPQLQLF
jgi:hypothetical protein